MGPRHANVEALVVLMFLSGGIGCGAGLYPRMGPWGLVLGIALPWIAWFAIVGWFEVLSLRRRFPRNEK